MNVQELLNSVDELIQQLNKSLKNLQNEDGGFKGYYVYDTESGIWTTAEILQNLMLLPLNSRKSDWLIKAKKYLLDNQNSDGGWGFRSGGKSITDITAWVCLALNHFNEKEAILRANEFILKARYNENLEEEKGGWGLTTYEPDRVYSTWIAIEFLIKLISHHDDWQLSSQVMAEIDLALSESRMWLTDSQNPDGGWSPTESSPSNFSSTAISLITLFMLGEDPHNYVNACDFLRKGMKNGLWELEREVVITQEGYELAQEWFTSSYCFRAIIFFAEMNLVSLAEVHEIYCKLITLIEDETVRPALGASRDLIWTIPFMIEALYTFRNLVIRKKNGYQDFLFQKELEHKRKEKERIEHLLKEAFPFPISQVFFSFSHEIDHHRKFQLLVQSYEVLIKYSAIVLLSYIIASHEKIPQLKSLLSSRLRRPSLGDWINMLLTSLSHSQEICKIIFPTTKNELTKRMPELFGEENTKTHLTGTLSQIVELRNSWTGHGAVRSAYEYKLKIEEQLPKLYTFIHRLTFLAKCNSFLVLSSDYNEFGDGDIYKIRVFNGLGIVDEDFETQRRLAEGQKEQMIRYLYFHNIENNSITNLYPFLSYMYCNECKRERFFFFNSIKNNSKVSYLSFECGHSKECDNYLHFKKRLAAIDVILTLKM